jgi:hypothetical protein
MIPESPALTFALTLKRWFAANDWPQRITDEWAKDEGVNAPNGPWASQMCAAMKGDTYSPRAEFFLALASFNDYIAKQDFKGLQNSKLRDRLLGCRPLQTDDGILYGGAEFWSLFAGLTQPPEWLASKPGQFTQEEMDEWVRIQRENFRKISLKHMCSRAEAWDMLKAEMEKYEDTSPDDLDWVQEILSGLVDPTADEGIRRAQHAQRGTPLLLAMEVLLGSVESKKQSLTV